MFELPIEASETLWEGPSQCEGCGIRDIALFSALKQQDFTLIHEQIDELRFTKNEPLYREGEPANYVFTVREGIVKLTHYSQNGNECIVRLLRRGDLAGLESLVELTYEQTAIVIDNALTCRIPVTAINELNQKLPHFKKELLRRWLDSLGEAYTWHSELRTGSAKLRFTRLLLHFAEKDSSNEIFIPTLDDVGSILAVTRESVNRIFSEFKRADLVYKVADRQIKVDIDGLRLLTQ